MTQVGMAFDLEGTTVNLETERHDAHLLAAASFGIVIDREFAVAQIEHFIGGPDERVAGDIFDLYSEQFSMPRTDFVSDFLFRDKVQFERMLQEVDVAPRPGVLEFISWLQDLSVPFSIGSLTSQEQAAVILSRSGLASVFKGNIILREDVENLKPAPDVYLKTAQIMGVLPEHQIVFEDSPRGVIAAIAARSHPIGMPVILQDSALEALSRAGVSAIFTDWRDPALKEHVGRLIEEIVARPTGGEEPRVGA